jgi:outer membrane lipoprotein-sorting protein
MATRVRSVSIFAVAAATGLLVVAGATIGRADPTPSLPPVSAERLLGSTLEALSQPFSISGDVRTTVDLGLPELPVGMGVATPGPLSAVASLTGTQRFKVWHSPEGVRVAHITDLGEQTVVANHTDAWLWDSSMMSAQHVVYADVKEAMASGAVGAWDAEVNPPGEAERIGDPTEIAGRALAAVAPYADVSVGGTTRVAGRPAYTLSLTPSSSLTLIGRITVAIDAQTRLPLQLRVLAEGATEPSIASTFTSVSYDEIDASMFAFTPPEGTSVSTPGLPTEAHAGADGVDGDPKTTPTTRTFGSGFDTRVAIRLDQPLPLAAEAFLPYAGPLGSVMTADVGGHTWLLFGPVGVDTLRTDAATLS